MAEGKDDDVPGLGQVFRKMTQLVVAQIQCHQITNRKNV